MTVRSTSAVSHAQNDFGTLSYRLRVYVRCRGPVTRRECAESLGASTATIAGTVTPLVDIGLLIEVGKGKCPITGRKSLMLESPVKQLELI